MKVKYNKNYCQEGYKIGKYVYKKGIRWTFLSKIRDFFCGSVEANFDMSSVTIKGKNGQEITIENDTFETLMAEYIKRKKIIKELNK